MSSPADVDVPAKRVRITQRAPQSCWRCSTKKIKCTKTVPCGPCISLGIHDRCAREDVIVTHEVRIPESSTRPKRRGRPPGSLNKQPTQKRRENDRSHTDVHRRSLSRENEAALHVPACLSTEIPARSTIPSSNEQLQFLTAINTHQNDKDPTFNGAYDHGHKSAPDLSPGGSSASAAVHGQHLPITNPTAVNLTGSSWTNDDASAENAAMTLEFLAWGRQRDAGVSPKSIVSFNTSAIAPEILTAKQALAVVEFHRDNLTWMHNTVNWSSFLEECQHFWMQKVVEDKSWLGLYYAVLCVGMKHMGNDQQWSLGLQNDSVPHFNLNHMDERPSLAKLLYNKAIDLLKDADFMTVHSTRSIQAICILSLVAHSFDGSNLISVLLSCAIRISQALNIHNLGPDPTSVVSLEESIDREIRKRIWCFLCIQDWFMIPFHNSYSIIERHCSTPLPVNSDESSGLPCSSRLAKVAEENCLSHMGYLLVMYKGMKQMNLVHMNITNRSPVASLYRVFFDKTFCLTSATEGSLNLKELYDHVLDTDKELKDVMRASPAYLHPSVTNLGDYPVYIKWQRRTFSISVAHKILMIHQRFFLKSLRDKWYTYTRIACIRSARTILNEYLCSLDETENDMWTILAHVISASIILLLDFILSEGEDPEELTSNKALVSSCLSFLEQSEKSSSIVVKGIGVIKILFEYPQQSSPPDLRQVALTLQNGNSVEQNLLAEQNHIFGEGVEQSWELNWNQFFNSFDMTFDGTFL